MHICAALENVLKRLENVKPSGDGFTARCPAHDDHRNSLSVGLGEDGKVVLHCHTDVCEPEAVVAAIGLTMPDLFPPGNDKPINDRSKIVHTYDYFDAAGKLLFQTVRLEPKGFFQRRPRKGGGWLKNLRGVEVIPYHLPELLDSEPSKTVFVVEGEKDADRLVELGQVATCNAGGAGKWKSHFAEYFRGRQVAIIPDSDLPGAAHTKQVAKSLLHEAASVKIVELPGLSEKGDMSDWLDAGNTLEQLLELVDVAPEVESADELVNALPDDEPEPYKEKRQARFKRFPLETLPEPVRSYVTEAAQSLGCDPSYVALPILSVLASSVGAARRIVLKNSWREPAIIWTAIVGESGTLKSPAHALAVEPIHSRQSAAFYQHAVRMKEYERDALQYEAELAAWKRKGYRDGEPSPEKPTEPVPERYLTEDCTIEALVDRLSEAPRGMLVARDELSGWLNSFNEYKSGKGSDAAAWLSMWRGDPVIVDRKTGARKTLSIERAVVSVCGSIQPTILRRALAREHLEDGLASRLLFAMPPARRKKWSNATLSDATRNRLGNVLDKLLALDFAATGCRDKQDPIDVQLTNSGAIAWERFYNEHAEKTEGLIGELAAAFAKLEAYGARLALIIHLVRNAAADPALECVEAVDAASIKAAVALIDWFANEAERVYSTFGESSGERKRRELLELIQRKGGSVTCRELMRSCRRFPTVDEAEKALAGLHGDGLGRWTTDDHDGGRGKPARRFVLTAVGSADVDSNSENRVKNVFLSPSTSVGAGAEPVLDAAEPSLPGDVAKDVEARDPQRESVGA